MSDVARETTGAGIVQARSAYTGDYSSTDSEQREGTSCDECTFLAEQVFAGNTRVVRGFRRIPNLTPRRPIFDVFKFKRLARMLKTARLVRHIEFSVRIVAHFCRRDLIFGNSGT